MVNNSIKVEKINKIMTRRKKYDMLKLKHIQKIRYIKRDEIEQKLRVSLKNRVPRPVSS